jgi:Fe-S-cluster containining protein
MLLEEEYKSLRKWLKNDQEGKRQLREARGRIEKLQRQGYISMMCPFSNANRKCAIYSKRPQICRDFHCDTELYKKFDKEKYDSEKHYTINDLIK